MVVDGSLKREVGTLNVSFVVTDNVHSVPVKYDQLLPDLFREGAGAVVIGKLNDNGEFIGEQVLAKHDENYMPPEVADALEKARAAQGQ
jgi:cytochrome c-type biogenesis protein CcmE